MICEYFGENFFKYYQNTILQYEHFLIFLRIKKPQILKHDNITL